jgi:hypothetical protein
MLAVPALTPQKVPLVPIVATDVALLLQVPPVTELLSSEQSPIHTRFVPVIAPGQTTVTVVVA